MKTLFAFIVCLNAYGATIPSGCGTFDVYGVIEKNQKAPGYVFLVNKGTLSEYQFAISDEQELKAAPYIDRTIKLRGKITKKLNGQQGEFSSIESYTDVVPDPANLKGLTGFTFIKKEKCK